MFNFGNCSFASTAGASLDLEDYALNRQKLLDSFSEIFPDDQKCWEHLLDKMVLSGLVRCWGCSDLKLEISPCFRKFRCLICKRSYFTTSGTFFHGVRKIRAWMFAIWIIEHGFYVSSKWLAQAISVSQSSALHILKTVLTVAEKSQKDLSKEALNTKLFHDFFAKRTCLTPAGQKPGKESGIEEETRDSSASADSTNSSDDSVSDQFEDDLAHKQSFESTSESSSEGAKNTKDDSVANCILAVLRESAKSVDELSLALGEDERTVLVSITELELEGLIFRLGGGRYSLKDSPDRSDENMPLTIGPEAFLDGSSPRGVEPLDLRFLEALMVFAKLSKVVLKGVSRKYLGLYIAAANEIVARSIQADALDFCLQAGYVGSRKLRKSVTGLKVEFVNQVSNSVPLLMV